MESINWEKCVVHGRMEFAAKLKFHCFRRVSTALSNFLYHFRSLPGFEKKEEIILEKIKMINFRFRISRDKNIRTKHWKFLKIPLSMKF